MRAQPHIRVSHIAVVLAALALVATACSSGPSPEALERNIAPSTTTTTEPLPPGIVIVVIENGAFRPSNLELDLQEFYIVEWRHQDTQSADDDGNPRTFEIATRRGELGAQARAAQETGDPDARCNPCIEFDLELGDVHQIDFRELEPGLYRYFTFLGQNRIPGTIDTRPSQ
ncbi:MAG: hypothetical protein KJN71_07500 [Acidimicrobiia bacterium]|nr:hypothetical protein [Acidimicrobiia bacterium]